MKFALILIIALSLASAYGQTKGEDAKTKSRVEQELLNLVRTWNEAEIKGDAAAISNLLADDFSFLAGSAKAEYLGLMKPDDSLIIESARIENSSVRVYGNAAVVTTLNSFKLRKNGQLYEGKFLSLTVWIQTSQRWQCVKASIQAAKS